MMTSLIQQRVESIDFIDSLNLEAEPHRYNSQYDCVSLVKLNEKAPSILKRHWIFWKTYEVDSIGYVSFDDFFELKGIPKSEALIVTDANRERIYFSLLTFEKDGIEMGQPFLILENELDDTNCLELDHLAIRFEGQMKKDRKRIDVTYTYRSQCKTIEDKKVASIFWVKR